MIPWAIRSPPVFRRSGRHDCLSISSAAGFRPCWKGKLAALDGNADARNRGVAGHSQEKGQPPKDLEGRCRGFGGGRVIGRDDIRGGLEG